MKKNTITSIVFAICMVIATGCSGSSTRNLDAASGANIALAGAAEGNSIVAYVGTAIFDSTLDPIKGAMSYGYPFTNAALIKVSPTSEYVGDMAADWQISDDSLTYTFTLNKGVLFSDGTEMSAHDVVFTYETVKENQAENETVDLTKLAAVTALDTYRVEFTLLEPYSPFLDTTAQLGIVPRDGYDKALFDHYPIGTGPFKVIQYDANQQIIVEPNEYYFEGAATIGRVTFVYMDMDAALAAAHTGQLDVVMVNPNQAGQTVSGMSLFPLETMDIRQVSLPLHPVTATGAEGITTGNAVTSDINVRKALSIGIDRAQIIQNAYNGIGKPATGFTSNLLWAEGSSYDDNRKTEAAALLDGAGWIDQDGDGFREKDGVPCEFDIYTAKDRFELTAALAEEAAILGIKINLHSASWDDIANNMNTSGVMWGWGQYSPTVIASLFHSKYAHSGGYDNVVAYQNEAVDTLIDSALESVSQEDAMVLWQQAQAIAKEDYPYLYLVNIEHCYFISDRLDIAAATQIPHPHGHGSPIICNMKDWSLK